MERDEIIEIIISWITLSVAFAWDLNPAMFLQALPITLLGVGTAFVFHELFHRFMANRLGYPARFIMWKEGLILAILLAIATNGRFVFAAPGAVYVFGHPRERDNGLISAAGPFANLLLAILFYTLALYTHGGIAILFYHVAKINAFIGFFNMLPIFPLDGSKVLPWNPGLYFILLAALGVLAFM